MASFRFARVLLAGLVIGGFAQVAIPQKASANRGNVRYAGKTTSVALPINIDNNIIRLRVTVNHSRPLLFIFDTGASHNIIDSKQASKLKLRPFISAEGFGIGGAIKGEAIEGVTMGVRGVSVDSQTIVSMPLNVPPGFEFDGVLGYDFIKQFVVEIDYLRKVMVLRNPGTFAYQGTGEIIPLILEARRTPIVDVSITLKGRDPIQAKLEHDTGFDSTIMLYSPSVKKFDLLSSLLKNGQGPVRGAGASEKPRIFGRVQNMRLGTFLFKDPPISLSVDNNIDEAKDSVDGVIGGEIFRRFKMIIDYSRKQMILEPNRNHNAPFDDPEG